MSSREALLTPAQAGARCGVCARTILRAIHAGRLRSYQLGTTAYRIAVEDLEAWLEQSVFAPTRRPPVSVPGVSLPRSEARPSVGHLTLTPEMGANTSRPAL